jgi:activating signal cointegrator complex subunit 1
MARKGKVIHGGYKSGSTAGPSRPHRGGSKKPPLTHFLCLPLVTSTSRPQLEASLCDFRSIISEENGRTAGEAAELAQIPLKAIRPVGTIHFTLGVMSLMSEDRIAEAIGHLQTLDLQNLMTESLGMKPVPSDTAPWPMQISLTSLHAMQPPKITSILYAGPEDPKQVLNDFCTRLSSQFRSAGFLLPDDRPLKLHATILNTIYAKTSDRGKQQTLSTLSISTTTQSTPLIQQGQDGSGQETVQSHAAPSRVATDEAAEDRSRGHGPNARAPIRLDATSLLERCKDFIWAADFTLEKIAICKMGAKMITDEDGNVIDEQYEEIASVPLPS